MLSENKILIWEDLIGKASSTELAWMNGYLNALVKKSGLTETSLIVEQKAVQKLTIVYGTETGNAKKLATNFAKQAKAKNILAKVIGMDQYKLTDLPNEEYLMAIVSTHGEGEPPAAAKNFYQHIHQQQVSLQKLKYSVLALGDTSYPLFCKTGEEMDERFTKLGGQRIVPLQKCDVEYEIDANNWFDNVLKVVQASTEKPNNQNKLEVPPVKKGKQVFSGEVLSIVNLNDKGSNKETYHIEIAAKGIAYQCGDSIGVVPQNPIEIVEAIIETVGIDSLLKVNFKNESFTILDLLKHKINIIFITERLVKLYADKVQQDIPIAKMNLLDLVKIYPPANTQQFVEIITQFNAISPRLYTIASSPSAHQNEIHLLVLKDQYEVDSTLHYGLCSSYLSGLTVGNNQQFFIQSNKRFRLPAQDKDCIMIGPGTGIAAFRSFLAERDVTGSTGKNWLFFGEQHFASDFLYQTEIQQWAEIGVLSKINVAFSRDQAEKIYVQHKMIQHAKELFNWIQNGAYVFVCGNKNRMSVEVEKTLLQIFQHEANFTEAQAHQYLEQLETEGRYEKDVY